MRDRVSETAEVDSETPDFTLTSADGDEVNLASSGESITSRRLG